MNEKRICDCTVDEIITEIYRRGLGNRISFWQDEDIECALQEQGVDEPTQEQIDAVWKHMSHWLCDALSECGNEFVADAVWTVLREKE